MTKPKTITMLFHAFGITSMSKWEVLAETPKYVILYDSMSPDLEWVFEKKTGKCLNDDNYNGCSRSINPIKWKTA